MKTSAFQRYRALLVISSALWISTGQAFFCFSENSRNRYREDYFSLPPPVGAFFYGDRPIPYYTGPVIPERAIAPVEIRNADYPALDPPIAPIELPNDDYPAQDGSVPHQHIFH